MKPAAWTGITIITITALSLAACAPKQSSLKLDPKEIAADHAKTWDSKNKAGLAAMTSGDLDEAEKSLVDGLKEAEECGQDDVRVAVSLNNLASLYEKKKMYSQCAGYLQKARKIFRKAYGDMNESIPVTERNEARILTKQEKWAESLPLYEEAIRYMEMLKSRDLEDVRKEYQLAKTHVASQGSAKPAATAVSPQSKAVSPKPKKS
ncbi:MAG TPA: tetratricopeptide repeat protein [Drouetiella sp.]|jgi:tetratricopeptide (TPR) repeat protein